MAEPHELLLQNLALIERIIAAACRRKGLTAEEIEEFSSDVHLRFVKDGEAIIQAFKGRGSFEGYLAAVIARLLVDFRNRAWGKWRTSAHANRLGELAVEVERLMQRDGRSIDDALVLLQDRYPEITRADIEEVASSIRPRQRRFNVELTEYSSFTEAAGSLPLERAESAALISDVVSAFIERLPEDDQLIFVMRFESDMSVSEISRALTIDLQALFRRFYRRFQELKKELEAAGVAADDVGRLIGSDPAQLDFYPKKREMRPSNAGESAVAGSQKEIP